MIYLPQLEQEQSEPQLPVFIVSIHSREMAEVGSELERRQDIQLEDPEHPHSPFMVMVLLVVWESGLLVLELLLS
jgi:hypothetical protein